MEWKPIDSRIEGVQRALYKQCYAPGVLRAIELAVADVTLETIKDPLLAIQYIAMACVNFIGAFFSARYKVRAGFVEAEWGLRHLCQIPVSLLLAPAKVVYQIGAILNPPTWERPKSIAYLA